MTTGGFSVQAVSSPGVKAYKQLCKYVTDAGKVFEWSSPGKRMRHKRSNYPGYVELEPTANEVLAAWISEHSPETLGSFIGIVIRCFGDTLVTLNVQRQD
jgi:hypothetical protein